MGVPKFFESFTEGTRSLSNLPVAVIVSLVALPRSTSPFACKVPPTVVMPAIETPPCL